MKTKSILKNIISTSIGLSFLVACSSPNSESNRPKGENAGMVIKTKADSIYVDWLNKVAKGEISLLAAEAMVPALKVRMQQTGEPLTISAIPGEAFDFGRFKYDIIKKQNAFIQAAMLGGSNIFRNNEDELHLTLPFNVESGNYTVLGIDRLIDLGILRAESQKRLEAVFKIYDDSAKQAATAEAQKRIVAAQMNGELANLSALPEEQKKAQVQTLIAAKKLDQVDTSGKPVVDVVVRKYLNEALYDLLMNNSYTRNPTISAAIAANTIEKLQKTAEAFARFRDSVQTTWSEMKNAQVQLTDGLKDVRNQMSGFNVEDFKNNPEAAEKWKKALEEGKHLIDGTVDSENPTTNEVAVSAAYKKVKESSQKLAKNTRTLADSGQLLVDAGKLFLDSETVSKAQAVVDGVNKVSMIVDKLSSGGVTGMIGAASIALGGVGGGVDVAASRHAELSGKLDALLQGQKIMIEMQRETLKLQKQTLQAVADVAQMIDINQRIMMARMDGMESQIVTLTEMNRHEARRDYNNCDHIIYGNTSDDEAERQSKLREGVHQAFQSFESLEALIGTSDLKDDYHRCWRGLQDLFLNEGQLSVLMTYGATVKRSETETSGLTAVEKVRLVPLKEAFIGKYQRNLRDREARYRALHLPVRFMSLVPYADQVFKNDLPSLDAMADQDRKYLLASGFLNPGVVINQVKALLEIAKMNSVLGDGKWGATEPLKMSETGKLQREIRSAQELVQTAIAQETLNSGEPVLSHLYDRVLAAMSQPGMPELVVSDCDLKLDYGRIGCMFRKNPILLHNFTQYFLHRKLASLISEPQDVLKVELGAAGQVSYRALFMEAENFRNGVASNYHLQKLGTLSYVKEAKVPTVKLGELEMALPTPEQYQADMIQYSTEMKELLSLQRDVIQTRLKLEKTDVTEEERRILAEFIFNNVN